MRLSIDMGGFETRGILERLVAENDPLEAWSETGRSSRQGGRA